MSVVTLLNQKGGVGKTSTTHHLAGTLAQIGQRVLVVDNDPQASLTQGFLGPQATRLIPGNQTVAEIYSGMEPFPEQVIRPTGIEGIDLIAGSKLAARYNVPEAHLAGYELQTAMREFLGLVRDRYGIILIDCPPNLHLCSWAALAASDYLIVPLQAEDYGAQGIIEVQESIDLVTSMVNPGLELLGYLLTMFNPRLGIHQLYEGTLRASYGSMVFRTTIPIATDYKEAIASRKPISHHKTKGAAAKAIKALASEVLGRIAERATTKGAA